MRQASRMWVRRYARPRHADGRIKPGYQLFTRPDGQTRWVRSFAPEDNVPPSLLDVDLVRYAALSLFVFVVALLLALFVR